MSDYFYSFGISILRIGQQRRLLNIEYSKLFDWVYAIANEENQ